MIQVHQHGFVRLVDTFGTDASIVEAARVSYGVGTKTISEDRGLIRTLIRERHTSPIEMVEVKYHVKLPIFVMRQLVRHRTASLNEYSGRYSIMSSDYYVPTADYIMPQSTDNKQGRAGVMPSWLKDEIIEMITDHSNSSLDFYRILNNDADHRAELVENYGEEFIFPENAPGISRELSRMVLPVNFYTECYWKQDLHNLMHLLKLRLDPHAQQEIRDYAGAMYTLIKPKFPIALEAFNDYVLESKTFSRMDLIALKDVIANSFVNSADHYGMSAREFRNFKAYFDL